QGSPPARQHSDRTRRAPGCGGRRWGDRRLRASPGRQCPGGLPTLAAPLVAALLLTPSLPDSTAARGFWLASLERSAMLDVDSELVLLRRSLQADPAYLPAAFNYLQLTQYRSNLHDDFLRQLRSRPEPVFRCLAIAADAPAGYPGAAAPG